MELIEKYPKTFHFSWSENIKNDDRVLPKDSILEGKKVVVTLKLDGENTGMTKEKCHARSLDSKDHASRHWVKTLHSTIKGELGNLKVFGENLFAKHSIFYPKLTTYFYVFSIWEGERVLSWDTTKEYASLLGLEVVPELYRGPWNENTVKACYSKNDWYFGGEQEGYVCRNTDEFLIKDFSENVGKMVRLNHVTTSQHWLRQQIVQNQIYIPENMS